MNKTKAFGATSGLSLAMVIAAFALVTSASAQTGGLTNQIVIRSQDTNSGQIVVDTVIAAQDGWLAIYTDTSISARTLVGWVPIHKGVNTNLKVDVNRELVEPYETLWAVLHVDRGVIGLMELPKIDGPAQQDGKTVIVAFGTQPSPAPAVSQSAATAAVVVPKASAAVVAPKASAGPPKILPSAGGSQSPWGLFLLGAGILLAAIGRCTQRACPAACEDSQLAKRPEYSTPPLRCPGDKFALRDSDVCGSSKWFDTDI